MAWPCLLEWMLCGERAEPRAQAGQGCAAFFCGAPRSGLALRGRARGYAEEAHSRHGLSGWHWPPGKELSRLAAALWIPPLGGQGGKTLRPARSARLKDLTLAQCLLTAPFTQPAQGLPVPAGRRFSGGEANGFCEPGEAWLRQQPLREDGRWRLACAFSASGVTDASLPLQPPFCLCSAQALPGATLFVAEVERTLGIFRWQGASLALWLAVFFLQAM
ncbi:hypothetical protein ACJJIX_20785 [Microbulbifer sp. VAAC004]|uniref:hypothetical protein n=1 Tax=unclassified Microbulbifer TaxID=2619833 RepID=UPI00403A3988